MTLLTTPNEIEKTIKELGKELGVRIKLLTFRC